MSTFEGKMTQDGIKVGIVVARFNEFITSKLLGGAMDGLIRHDVKEQDIDESYQIVKLPITALGKAWCDDSTEGFIKLIVKDELIKGAHIVSKEASSLIHIILVAMQNNISINKLKQVCFAHPTYAEGISDLIMNI